MPEEVTIIKTSEPQRVLLKKPEKEVIAIKTPAAQGPAGINGIDGASLQFVFEQNVPASTWTVTHTLAKYPSVTVVDSAGTTVEGLVTYDSLDQITITFNASFSGVAYLN